MSKKIKRRHHCIILLMFSISFFPIKTFANIICNDGTISANCQSCEKGCCSKHKRCTDNPHNNGNSYYTSYYEDSSKKNNNEIIVDENIDEKSPKDKSETSIINLLSLVILGIPFILGVIGVIIEKIRTGINWNGQGYGK